MYLFNKVNKFDRFYFKYKKKFLCLCGSSTRQSISHLTFFYLT